MVFGHYEVQWRETFKLRGRRVGMPKTRNTSEPPKEVICFRFVHTPAAEFVTNAGRLTSNVRWHNRAEICTCIMMCWLGENSRGLPN